MEPEQTMARRQSMPLLGAVAQLHSAWLDRILAQDGLTLAQFSILTHLAQHTRAQRVSDIARATGAKQPFVTKVATKFVALGLITAKGDPQDARSKLVRITPEGHALLAQIRARLAPEAEMLLAGWKDKEIKRLNAYLGRLADWYVTLSR